MYLSEIKIIPYHDQFKDIFKTINYEWIEEYFTVTELDKKAFENPQKEILDKGGYVYLAKEGLMLYVIRN